MTRTRTGSAALQAAEAIMDDTGIDPEDGRISLDGFLEMLVS